MPSTISSNLCRVLIRPFVASGKFVSVILVDAKTISFLIFSFHHSPNGIKGQLIDRFRFFLEDMATV